MATKRKSVKNARTVSGATGSTKAVAKGVAKQPTAAGQSGRLEKQSAAAAGAGKRAKGAGGQSGGAGGSAREGAPRKRADGKRRWPWYVALVVVAVLLLVAAAFSWDRWLRYDDARELQGEWQVGGTTRVVVVDGASIKLTDDVAYAYTIDPAAKTIEFTFGNMEGSGRYRFSADRTQLVVTEGSSYSALSTLLDDLGWMWDGFVRSVQGRAPAQPEAGDGTTVLVRVSHDAAAQPRNDEGLAASSAGTDPAAGDAPAAGSIGGDAGSGSEDAASAPADAAGSGNAADADDAASSTSPSDGSGSGAPSPGEMFDVSDAGV